MIKLIAGPQESVQEIEIRLIESDSGINIAAYAGGNEVRAGHIGRLQVVGDKIRLLLAPSLNPELFHTVPGGYIEVAKA